MKASGIVVAGVPSRIAGMIACILAVAALVVGCSCGKTDTQNDGTSPEATSSAPEPDTPAADQSVSDGYGLLGSDTVQRIEEKSGELESAVADELEARENAVPLHVALGEEVDVTANLAVRVVSVEKGPFNHGTNSPTVRVIVEFRNKTDKTLMVKPSNVDADTADGRRIDHKLYVKDENGKRDTRSFLPTNVSPGATFTGTVYFDAEAMESVIYEPHFLVSAQNQYVYWDCKQDES